MRINIYYGGRGLLEDPTLYVLDKITKVLEELRVQVVRYNMYEDKSSIATLPSTLKEADGVILAASVEWYGIGGMMQQFLDMCWLYGDRNKMSQLYMMPVVLATANGERDAELTLLKAWDILGGNSMNGIIAYVDNGEEFERNTTYANIIDKRIEDFYRSINQKVINLPTSNKVGKDNLIKRRSIELTPQESEQLSKFVSDDGYVKKQKEDIEELSAMFKQLLGKDKPAKVVDKDEEMINNFKENYYPDKDFNAKYVIIIPDLKKNLIVEAEKTLKCKFGEEESADVILKVDSEMLNSIIKGKMTFQKGFMSGEITAKGNFKTLRMLDQIFRFRYKK